MPIHHQAVDQLQIHRGPLGLPGQQRQAVGMLAFMASLQVVVELLAGGHLEGIVFAADEPLGVGLGKAQFGHRGQRIANCIKSISFLSIRLGRLAIAAYGGKRMGGGQINCSIPCQPEYSNNSAAAGAPALG